MRAAFFATFFALLTLNGCSLPRSAPPPSYDSLNYESPQDNNVAGMFQYRYEHEKKATTKAS